MNKKQTIVRFLALGALLILAMNVTLAAAPASQTGEQPQGNLSIEAFTSSKFSYQGILRQDDNPVTGSRSMVFRLYSDSGCTTQVGSDINLGSVSVSEGHFDVDLQVDQSDFDGQKLWLQAEVEGTAVGCEEIVAVPYALSLRPGATLSASGLSGIPNLQGDVSTSAGWKLGDADITFPSTYEYYGVRGSAMGGDAAYGVEGTAESTDEMAYGVYGAAISSNGNAYGLYGEADATLEGARAYGVYARGDNGDLVLGGDDGSIRSDPDVPNSRLILTSDEYVEIHLDADGASGSAQLEVYNEADNEVFSVSESGRVSQLRTGDGLVKAAAKVYCADTGSTVGYFFNNVNNTTPKVGNGTVAGECTIDFEFQVNDRYWSATAADAEVSVACAPSGTEVLQCSVWGMTGVKGNNDIFVVIY